MAIKRKLVEESIGVDDIAIMISEGCTVVDLIAELECLIKKYGDTITIYDDGYSYDDMGLSAYYSRPETDEEFNVRKVRSENYKKSTAKRKETLRKKREAELAELQKKMDKIQKSLEVS